MRLLSDDELKALRPAADLGQLFAQTTVAQPRLTAALMGMLVSRSNLRYGSVLPRR
jgi:hypothetical protein